MQIGSDVDAALIAFEKGSDAQARVSAAAPSTSAVALDRSNAALHLNAEMTAVRREAREIFEKHKARLRATVAKRVKAGKNKLCFQRLL